MADSQVLNHHATIGDPDANLALIFTLLKSRLLHERAWKEFVTWSSFMKRRKAWAEDEPRSLIIKVLSRDTSSREADSCEGRNGSLDQDHKSTITMHS